MKLNLYNDLGNNKEVKREPELVGVFEGTLKADSTSISDPVITVLIKGKDISRINYAYIEQFRRFYFVKEVNILNKHMAEFVLHVDVLKSFWNEYSGNDSYIASSQNYGVMYLNDPNIAVQQNTKITNRHLITSPFHGAALVLTALNTSRSVYENFHESEGGESHGGGGRPIE